MENYLAHLLMKRKIYKDTTIREAGMVRSWSGSRRRDKRSDTLALEGKGMEKSQFKLSLSGATDI